MFISDHRESHFARKQMRTQHQRTQKVHCLPSQQLFPVLTPEQLLQACQVINVLSARHSQILVQVSHQHLLACHYLHLFEDSHFQLEVLVMYNYIHDLYIHGFMQTYLRTYWYMYAFTHIQSVQFQIYLYLVIYIYIYIIEMFQCNV